MIAKCVSTINPLRLIVAVGSSRKGDVNKRNGNGCTGSNGDPRILLYVADDRIGYLAKLLSAELHLLGGPLPCLSDACLDLGAKLLYFRIAGVVQLREKFLGIGHQLLDRLAIHKPLQFFETAHRRTTVSWAYRLPIPRTQQHSYLKAALQP